MSTPQAKGGDSQGSSSGLMARYSAVWRHAWAHRAELAGPARGADETAVLPAALSLQNTPVHPAPRRLAWALMGLFTAAVAWTVFGQVDIVAVAPGRIMVPGDPELDRRTPPGDYRITSKHVATTMDGDVTNDGPYSIEDVPWVQYFKGSYALHGAFWHDDFGHVHSHGCVNLAPEDARNLFEWTEPHVPANWHGVSSGDDGKGTIVHVHD